MSQPRNPALIVAALLAFSGTASAQDVQSGIAAWQAGDYANAVGQWRPLADRGDADAQFNLGQAYRLGRGVPQNLNLAEQWFERAARQRHEQAGASLGLLLFQNGRAREAMPWIQAAAMRGDPRAQYVFGTALFNGDILRRDLPRAYAMMSAAAAQGFPQAQSQLAAMEQQIGPEDRERGRQIATQMSAGPDPQVAAVEPRPNVPPSSPPRRVNGRPDAGVSYRAPGEDRGPPAPLIRTPSPAPVHAENHARRIPGGSPHAAPPRTTPPRAAPAQSGGSWRVQLGAFSSEANARRQWESIRRRVAALGPLRPAFSAAGSLTRLRAGGLPDRAAAERVCSAVRGAGGDCIPVVP